MIATAMGPKNALRVSGIMASTAVAAVRAIGRKSAHRGLHDRRREGKPCFAILLDLVHQDHGVAHDHPGQRNGAEHRDEAERLVEDEQEQRDADQAERRGEDHYEDTLETLQLQHQYGQHDDQEERHAGHDRCLPLGAFFDSATRRDEVTGGKLRFNRLEVGKNLGRHRRRLDIPVHVGTHGDGGQPVAAPHDSVFEPV